MKQSRVPGVEPAQWELLVVRPQIHARWAPRLITRHLGPLAGTTVTNFCFTTHYAARLLPASRHPTRAPIHRLLAFLRPTSHMVGGSVR
jgi:hypothetical protein